MMMLTLKLSTTCYHQLRKKKARDPFPFSAEETDTVPYPQTHERSIHKRHPVGLFYFSGDSHRPFPFDGRCAFLFPTSDTCFAVVIVWERPLRTHVVLTVRTSRPKPHNNEFRSSLIWLEYAANIPTPSDDPFPPNETVLNIMFQQTK